MARKFLKKFPRRGHKSDALARRTLQNAKKEALNRWIFKKYIDDSARFASDFRVRNLARSAKFFRHKKRRIVQNDAAKTKVSSVDIPTGWDPRTKQQRRVALADFSAAPWQGFEKSERGPNSSSLFQPLAAVVAVALGWLLALPAAGPCCSNPSRSQSQRVTYVYTKEKQQR